MPHLFVGRVIGTKMQKTAKVSVVRMFLDPNVVKFVRQKKTFFAHDEHSQCRDGDLVMIRELPNKISKNKFFTLVEVLEKADSYTNPVTGQTYYQQKK